MIYVCREYCPLEITEWCQFSRLQPLLLLHMVAWRVRRSEADTEMEMVCRSLLNVWYVCMCKYVSVFALLLETGTPGESRK